MAETQAAALRYFAYGSNMSLARLRERVPSAERLGSYQLPGHELRFHKAGSDGSGKCDAFHTGRDPHRVFGVLFHIDPGEKPTLDRVEGLGWGYAEKQVSLRGRDGDVVRAWTYYALRLDPSAVPYSWYLQHVLVGAREAGLPDAYIAGIAAQDVRRDPQARRERRELGIYAEDLP